MQAPADASNTTSNEPEESHFDLAALRYNFTTTAHMRTGAAIISGFTAGTLGLTVNISLYIYIYIQPYISMHIHIYLLD